MWILCPPEVTRRRRRRRRRGRPGMTAPAAISLRPKPRALRRRLELVVLRILLAKALQSVRGAVRHVVERIEERRVRVSMRVCVRGATTERARGAAPARVAKV